MAMKGYSKFPKAPGLKPHQWMQFRVISRTFVGMWGLTPWQRCSWHILQPQPTGFGDHTKVKKPSMPYYLVIAGGRKAIWIPIIKLLVPYEMQQPCPGFELCSPCPFPMTINITPWEPPDFYIYTSFCHNIDSNWL